MFLRRYVRRKNGKPHTYWALAESYRTAKGSRQRIVAYLGELGAAEQDGWTALGSHLAGEAKARRPQRTLFDPPQYVEPPDDQPLQVKLSSIQLERTRDFGERRQDVARLGSGDRQVPSGAGGAYGRG